MPSVGVKDVDQQAFVRALSAFLKKSGKLKVPDWVDVVKTAIYKELAPYDEDWFYTRCASVARHLYMRSPSGVKAMRKIYGGRYRKGVRPSHFCPASASVARKALQALEQLKLVEQDPSGAAGVFIAALLGTVLLLVLPQGEGQKTKSVDMTDLLFIWRNSLTVLLGLCTLASPALLLKMHWSVPVQAHSLSRMRVVRRRSVAVGATAEESEHT